MSAAKHTPGPWSVIDVVPHCEFEIHGAPGTYVIARGIFYARDSLKTAAADARLIAAAPELLRACEMALSCMAPEDNDVTAKALRAAIAKARGGA